MQSEQLDPPGWWAGHTLLLCGLRWSGDSYAEAGVPVGFREFYPIGTPTPQRRLPLKTMLDLIDSSICEVDFVIDFGMKLLEVLFGCSAVVFGVVLRLRAVLIDLHTGCR